VRGARRGAAPAAAVAPVGVRAAAPPPEPTAPPVIQRRRPPARKSVLPWILLGGVLAAAAAVVVVLVLSRGKDDDAEPAIKPSAVRIDPRQQKINDAIAKGVAYLKKQLLDDIRDYYVADRGGGSKVGVVALAGLTLLECGESTGDPAVLKAVETVRHGSRGLQFTYSLALNILFLDRWYEAKSKESGAERRDREPLQRDRDLIQRLATQMIAAQNANGGWDYYCPPIPEARHQEILKTLSAGGTVAKRDNQKDDNSINQFCTLALWAARKHGVKADGVIKAIEARYRKNQNPNGSWGYRVDDKDEGNKYLRDATTCAGLIGLAVGQGVDRDTKRPDLNAAPKDVTKDDPGIARALAYISKTVGANRRLDDKLRQTREKHTREMMDLYREWHAATDERKKAIEVRLKDLDHAQLLKGTYFSADAWGDLYFLWSVERVAVVFDLKTIGGTDWYKWGADIILKHQLADGSWRDRFPGVCDTCFALLFLKRANMVKDLTDKLRAVGRAPGISTAPPPRRPTPAQPMRRPEDA
jgi:hypothetical protein